MIYPEDVHRVRADTDSAKEPEPRWKDWLSPDEKQRLSVIEERIGRNELTRRDLFQERQRIMRRCIKREQRSKRC